MLAFDEEGNTVGRITGENSHYPLYFTSAQGHMYWHCNHDDIKSMSERAKTMHKEGSKHFVDGGDTMRKDDKDNKPTLYIVHEDDIRATDDEMNDEQVNSPVIILSEPLEESKVLLVKGAKDVEQLFYKVGWIWGVPKFVRTTNGRVTRFTMRYEIGS